MRVRYQPEARANVIDAAEWYEREASVDRALNFLTTYDEEIREIGRTPLQSAIVGGTVRRRNMRVYPYGIFYRVDSGIVTILAVRHHSREPIDWDRRP